MNCSGFNIKNVNKSKDQDYLMKEFLTEIANTFENNQILAIECIGNEKLQYIDICLNADKTISKTVIYGLEDKIAKL